MTPHPYIYEKLIADHHAQIQHEMQQIRLRTHARQRPTLVRFIVGSLGRALIVLGSHLQRTEQQKEASVRMS